MADIAGNVDRRTDYVHYERDGTGGIPIFVFQDQQYVGFEAYRTAVKAFEKQRGVKVRRRFNEPDDKETLKDIK